MTWYVLRLEDRATGDSASYGPFASRDVADLNDKRVEKWLTEAGTRDEISLTYERVHRFSQRRLQEDGWLTSTDDYEQNRAKAGREEP